MNNSLNDIPKICRTCLVEITEESDIFLLDSVHSSNTVITLKHKLKTCLKELNLKITPNAVICGDCYVSINFMYKFKKRCLQTEEYINDYLQSVGSSTYIGNLLHVVHETKKNFSTYRDTNVIKLEYSNMSEVTNGVNDLPMIELDQVSFNNNENVFDKQASQEQIDMQKNFSTYHDTNVIKLEYSNMCEVKNGVNDLPMIELDQVSFNNIENVFDEQASQEQIDMQNNSEQVVDSTSKIYQCYHCSYRINYKPALSRHIHSKHKDELLIHTKSKKLYRCPACTYTFKKKKFKDNKPFKCKNCKYTATNVLGIEKIKYSRKKHHKNDKYPCKCTKCNYKAATKNLLKSQSTDAYKRFQILACKLLEEAYDVIK